MNPVFWTHTIWYLLLAITTVFELILVLSRAESRKTVAALYFSVSGMAFSIEAVICCFLKAYTYSPMIFPQSPFDDWLAGNLFSQFSISATALLIAILRLKHYWSFLIALGYGLVEELFLYLGIYAHNWYRTWMTEIGITVFFRVTGRIYIDSLKSISLARRYAYIFFGLFTLHMPTIIWTFKLSGIQTFSYSILKDAVSSYSLLALINLFVLANTIMIIHILRFKWHWKASVILALYIAYYIMFKLDLIYIKEGWFLIFTTVNIFGMYLYTYIMEKLYE